MQKLPKITQLLILTVLVGIVAGTSALLFDWLLKLLEKLVLWNGIGFIPPKPPGEGALHFSFPKYRFLFPIVLAVGGLISGFLIFTFAPETEGHGTDSAIEAFHFKRAHIRWQVPIIKMIASSITIGSGGSAGREGPIAQISAGFGSLLGKVLKLPLEHRRLLLVVGMGAGIGSIFRAPFGGALFAVEVLYTGMDMEMEALLPTVIGSIAGYSLFGVSHGWKPIFSTSGFSFSEPIQLLFYAGLGLILGLLAHPYVRIFYLTRDLFHRLQIPNAFKPALGGLILGVIAMFFPYCLGMGYGWIQLAMAGELSLLVLLLFPFMKMVATSLTISSGGSGGIFAPSLVIGGMIGGLFSTVLSSLLPSLELPVEPFVVVGMAGYIAAVAKVPLAGLIMTMEMTGGYGLIVPALAVIVFSILTSGHTTIYEKQVMSKLHSPARMGDFAVDILEKIKVGQILHLCNEAIKVSEATPLSKLMGYFTSSKANIVCVERDGRYRGIISLRDLREVIVQGDLLHDLVLAHDLITHNEEVLVKEDDNLKDVMVKFTRFELEELPVLSNNGKVEKVISRNAVFMAYSESFRKEETLH